MSNIKNEQLYNEMLNVATNRRTAKQYDPEMNVDKDTLSKIYQFTKTAPHSMGLELVRIVSIGRDSEHKQGINDYMKGFNQERAYMASEIALLITKKESFLDVNNELLNSRGKRSALNFAESNGTEYVEGSEKGFVEMAATADHANNGGNGEEWLARQAYIHLGYLLLAASSLGVETTTMEGFTKELNDYLIDNELINNDERVTLAVAMGYVNEDAKGTFIGDKQLRIDDDEYFKFH